MSHHLDSELARRDSRIDLTDQYMFRGTNGTVLVMNVNSSILGADYRAGFHPEARYEFKVHFDGEAVEDLTYRVTFGPAEDDGRQRVVLGCLRGGDARGDTAEGIGLASGRTHEPLHGPAGMRLWAGVVRDPFYNDLTLLSALIPAVKDGTRPDLGDWRPDKAENGIAGTEVHSIVLEIPDGEPYLPGRDIALWTVTKLPTDFGGWQQVNRQATPMLWPLIRTSDPVWAIDANRTHPGHDVHDDGERLTGVIAAVVAANRTSLSPRAYAETLVRRLLPDLMPYRIGSEANFGLSGVNGRSLADNAVETMYSLVFNAAISVGLRPEDNADTRSEQFPYVVAIR
ncbi:DUF4331 family protein [Asanoa siamensis]|uniref:DUF4331 domain-containing protein n=1 Tax=Asanoa siamensis TaxID=926357 RepID=A0ABQ4CYZ1_9ACTN|nr:DUF4331 family protein [Asanoa siamensis]GIF76510.1 hypothetical protein Asi02nite_60280 [Asanoa siamensis]